MLKIDMSSRLSMNGKEEGLKEERNGKQLVKLRKTLQYHYEHWNYLLYRILNLSLLL